MKKLDEMAASEQFLAPCRVVGQIVEIGDLEKAEQQIKQSAAYNKLGAE